VRSDDAEVLDVLRAAYSAHLVDDDRAVDDLGMVLHPPIPGVGTARSRLQHGRCDLVVGGSIGRKLRALDGLLGRAALPGHPGGSVIIRDRGAVVVDGRAVLVPRALLNRSSGVERAIAAAGGAIADPEVVRLAPATSELVVVDGLLGPDAEGFDDPISARPGRYRCVAVCWPEHERDAEQRPSLALVRLAARALDLGPVDPSPVLEGMAAMLTDQPFHVTIGTTGTRDVSEILDRVSSLPG
jgi:hypothetical protein